jgi:hypothetical protein
MSQALYTSRRELVELCWPTTLSSALEGSLADHLAQLSIFLEMLRKQEWRDPDSNRGHHDFQLGNEDAVGCR